MLKSGVVKNRVWMPLSDRWVGDMIGAHRCLLRKWMCDGIRDCENGNDESEERCGTRE